MPRLQPTRPPGVLLHVPRTHAVHHGAMCQHRVLHGSIP